MLLYLMIQYNTLILGKKLAQNKKKIGNHKEHFDTDLCIIKKCNQHFVVFPSQFCFSMQTINNQRNATIKKAIRQDFIRLECLLSGGHERWSVHGHKFRINPDL